MQHITTDRLIDYLHGELADGEDASIHAHLAECAICHAELERERGLTDTLRLLADRAEREFPAGLRTSILDAIAAGTPTPMDRIRAWLRPIVTVPLAVGLAAAAFVLVPLASHDHPSMPVQYYLEEHAAQAQANPIADRSATVGMFVSAADRASSNAPFIEAANAATIGDDSAAVAPPSSPSPSPVR